MFLCATRAKNYFYILKRLEESERIRFCDMCKLCEIYGLVFINKVLLVHGPTVDMPSLVAFVFQATRAKLSRCVWLAKSDIFSLWLFTEVFDP